MTGMQNANAILLAAACGAACLGAHGAAKDAPAGTDADGVEHREGLELK